MKGYFSIKEAAEYCGYAYQTFYKHMKDCPLPRYGRGKNRLKREDLDRWMQDPEAFEVEAGRPQEARLLTLEEQKARLGMGSRKAA